VSLGSVFSKLGKSTAFKETLAAVGAAAAGALTTKLAAVAAPKAAAEATKAAALEAAKPTAAPGVSLVQQIPWASLLLVGAVGVLGFVLVRMRRGKGAK